LEEIVLSETIKASFTPLMQKLMRTGSKVIDLLKSDFSIEGQEVTFLCPENLQKWSIVFTCKKGLLGQKKIFKVPNLSKVRLKSLIPLKDLTNEGIRLIEDGGFELLYSPLLKDSLYLLEVELDIDNPRLIEGIVHRRVQREVPHLDKREYWMHAQLRFVDVFEKFFSNLSLENIDFNVNVGVHQDIKASIPSVFQKELELIVKWIETSDREMKRRLTVEHLRMKRKRGVIKRKHLLMLLGELQDIFLPSTFRKFVEVKKDFYYHDCLRGHDYYTMPFPTWPKFMTVVSRTDLTLDQPAAAGVLEFKQKDFKHNVEKIFEKL
jgi:hypothetical protein